MKKDKPALKNGKQAELVATVAIKLETETIYIEDVELGDVVLAGELTVIVEQISTTSIELLDKSRRACINLYGETSGGLDVTSNGKMTIFQEIGSRVKRVKKVPKPRLPIAEKINFSTYDDPTCKTKVTLGDADIGTIQSECFQDFFRHHGGQILILAKGMSPKEIQQAIAERFYSDKEAESLLRNST
ncbi:hypothetical protein JCM19241_5209 [Vibrio ishigakensis]|uniref:Uncharacterized protein n=1 Tax=Vibrio ishigakensis TaxID=1481914 RepID=A0A0B8QFR3_9VIBR|nr:hypothetical protein JCM19241_5209 [Vibrio ishigakensis]